MHEELKNVGIFGHCLQPELRDRWQRNLSQLQILKGIQDKNTVVPKDFFDGFQWWNDRL